MSLKERDAVSKVFKSKHLDWICAGPPFITNPDCDVIIGHINSINERG